MQHITMHLIDFKFQHEQFCNFNIYIYIHIYIHNLRLVANIWLIRTV